MSESPGFFSQLFAEMRRRHVFRAVGFYAAIAFGVLQLADIFAPEFGLSPGFMMGLLIAITAGFPIVVALTWFFEIGDTGIRLTPSLTREESSRLAHIRPTDVLVVLIALGVGYLYLERFLGERDVPAEVAAEPASVAPMSAMPLERSVAVLPFDNLSDSDENEWFAAGVQEDILNHLARNKDLIVTSRNSTLVFTDRSATIADIARELDVNYVLEGSVRRAGNNVRISAQLIEARSDSHVWSNAYDREITDIFKVQDEIAQEISEALNAQFDLIVEAPPTTSLEAYRAFIRGRAGIEEFLPGIGVSTALLDTIEQFQRAVELDSEYADAWAGLSLMIGGAIFNGVEVPATFADQREAAERALALDPDGWQPNRAMGWYYYVRGEGEYDKAHAHFERALADNPNDAVGRWVYGLSLTNSGDTQGALTQYRLAHRLNPLSVAANMSRAYAEMYIGNRIAARRFAQKGLGLAPHAPFVVWWAGTVYQWIFDDVTALNLNLDALEMSPEFVNPYFTITTILVRLGEWETADHWSDRGLAIDPSNSGLLRNKSQALRALGRSRDAVTLLEAQLAANPDNLQLIAALADVQEDLALRAHREEDLATASAFSQAALTNALRVIQKPDGTIALNLSQLGAAFTGFRQAHYASETELADAIGDAVYSFVDRQEEAAYPIIQTMQAHVQLLNDDVAGAVASLKLARDYGVVSVLPGAMIEDIETNAFGLYSGTDQEIALGRMLASMDQAREEAAARVRAEVPALFDSGQ